MAIVKYFINCHIRSGSFNLRKNDHKHYLVFHEMELALLLESLIVFRLINMQWSLGFRFPIFDPCDNPIPEKKKKNYS